MCVRCQIRDAAVQQAAEISFAGIGPEGIFTAMLKMLAWNWARVQRDLMENPLPDGSGEIEEDMARVLFGEAIPPMLRGYMFGGPAFEAMVGNLVLSIIQAQAFADDDENTTPQDIFDRVYAEKIATNSNIDDPDFKAAMLEARASFRGEIEMKQEVAKARAEGKTAKDVVDELLKDVFGQQEQ